MFFLRFKNFAEKNTIRFVMFLCIMPEQLTHALRNVPQKQSKTLKVLTETRSPDFELKPILLE